MFRVGDRVKCIDAGHTESTGLQFGAVYTVDGYDGGLLKFTDTFGTWFDWRFELVDGAVVPDKTVDMVNKPPHYLLMPDEGIEVIDVLDALCKKLDNKDVLSSAETSYYVQAIGYLLRFMDKNGIEDIKKAIWYLNRLTQSMEKRDGKD